MSKKNNLINVMSVASGNSKKLSFLNDGVFSEKMLGDGMVVKLPDNIKKCKIFAPISGELVTVFPTGHAYGLKNKDGIEILVHIGIDTVSLGGKGFKSFVKQGQNVKIGEKIAEVNVKSIINKVPSVDPIVVVTSGQKIQKIEEKNISESDILFSI